MNKNKMRGKIPECRICGERFQGAPNIIKLVNHWKKHHQNGIARPILKKNVNYAEIMKSVIERVKENKSKNSFPPELRNSDSNPDIHNKATEKVKSVSRILKCKKCGKKVSSFLQALSHSKEHKSTERPITSKKLFQCNKCSKKCSNILQALSHSKEHEAEKLISNQDGSKKLQNLGQDILEKDISVVKRILQNDTSQISVNMADNFPDEESSMETDELKIDEDAGEIPNQVGRNIANVMPMNDAREFAASVQAGRGNEQVENLEQDGPPTSSASEVESQNSSGKKFLMSVAKIKPSKVNESAPAASASETKARKSSGDKFSASATIIKPTEAKVNEGASALSVGVKSRNSSGEKFSMSLAKSKPPKILLTTAKVNKSAPTSSPGKDKSQKSIGEKSCASVTINKPTEAKVNEGASALSIGGKSQKSSGKFFPITLAKINSSMVLHTTVKVNRSALTSTAGKDKSPNSNGEKLPTSLANIKPSKTFPTTAKVSESALSAVKDKSQKSCGDKFSISVGKIKPTEAKVNEAACASSSGVNDSCQSTKDKISITVVKNKPTKILLTIAQVTESTTSSSAGKIKTSHSDNEERSLKVAKVSLTNAQPNESVSKEIADIIVISDSDDEDVVDLPSPLAYDASDFVKDTKKPKSSTQKNTPINLEPKILLEKIVLPNDGNKIAKSVIISDTTTETETELTKSDSNETNEISISDLKKQSAVKRLIVSSSTETDSVTSGPTFSVPNPRYSLKKSSKKLMTYKRRKPIPLKERKKISNRLVNVSTITKKKRNTKAVKRARIIESDSDSDVESRPKKSPWDDLIQSPKRKKFNEVVDERPFDVSYDTNVSCSDSSSDEEELDSNQRVSVNSFSPSISAKNLSTRNVPNPASLDTGECLESRKNRENMVTDDCKNTSPRKEENLVMDESTNIPHQQEENSLILKSTNASHKKEDNLVADTKVTSSVMDQSTNVSHQKGEKLVTVQNTEDEGVGLFQNKYASIEDLRRMYEDITDSEDEIQTTSSKVNEVETKKPAPPDSTLQRKTNQNNRERKLCLSENLAGSEESKECEIRMPILANMLWESGKEKENRIVQPNSGNNSTEQIPVLTSVTSIASQSSLSFSEQWPFSRQNSLLQSPSSSQNSVSNDDIDAQQRFLCMRPQSASPEIKRKQIKSKSKSCDVDTSSVNDDGSKLSNEAGSSVNHAFQTARTSSVRSNLTVHSAAIRQENNNNAALNLTVANFAPQNKKATANVIADFFMESPRRIISKAQSQKVSPINSISVNSPISTSNVGMRKKFFFPADLHSSQDCPTHTSSETVALKSQKNESSSNSAFRNEIVNLKKDVRNSMSSKTNDFEQNEEFVTENGGAKLRVQNCDLHTSALQKDTQMAFEDFSDDDLVPDITVYEEEHEPMIEDISDAEDSQGELVINTQMEDLSDAEDSQGELVINTQMEDLSDAEDSQDELVEDLSDAEDSQGELVTQVEGWIDTAQQKISALKAKVFRDKGDANVRDWINTAARQQSLTSATGPIEELDEDDITRELFIDTQVDTTRETQEKMTPSNLQQNLAFGTIASDADFSEDDAQEETSSIMVKSVVSKEQNNIDAMQENLTCDIRVDYDSDEADSTGELVIDTQAEGNTIDKRNSSIPQNITRILQQNKNNVEDDMDTEELVDDWSNADLQKNAESLPRTSTQLSTTGDGDITTSQNENKKRDVSQNDRNIFQNLGDVLSSFPESQKNNVGDSISSDVIDDISEILKTPPKRKLVHRKIIRSDSSSSSDSGSEKTNTASKSSSKKSGKYKSDSDDSSVEAPVAMPIIRKKATARKSIRNSSRKHPFSSPEPVKPETPKQSCVRCGELISSAQEDLYNHWANDCKQT